MAIAIIVGIKFSVSSDEANCNILNDASNGNQTINQNCRKNSTGNTGNNQTNNTNNGKGSDQTKNTSTGNTTNNNNTQNTTNSSKIN